VHHNPQTKAKVLIMQIEITITEAEVRKIIQDALSKKGIEVETKDINIMVKSKQNYRSEWEQSDFKATVLSFQ
jgi:microcystin degradation protein MlrC